MASTGDQTLEEPKTSLEEKPQSSQGNGESEKLSDIFGAPKTDGAREGDLAGSKSESGSPSKHEGHVVIGEGVKIVGDIRDCQKIDVYGTVEGDLEVEELIVHEKGLHKGNVKTDRAEVYGSIDGELCVKHLLDVKASGSVAGKTQYGDIAIEVGGRVIGTLDDGSARKWSSTDTSSFKARTDRILSKTETPKQSETQTKSEAPTSSETSKPSEASKAGEESKPSETQTKSEPPNASETQKSADKS